MRSLAVHLLPLALTLGALAAVILIELLVARARRSTEHDAPTLPAMHARRLDATDEGDDDNDGDVDRLAYALVPITALQCDDLVLCAAGDVIPVDCRVVSGRAWTDAGPLVPRAAAPAGAVVRAGYVVVCAHSRATSAGTSTSSAAAPNGTATTSRARRLSQAPAPASPVSEESASA